jgi:hypothetical protein
MKNRLNLFPISLMKYKMMAVTNPEYGDISSKTEYFENVKMRMNYRTVPNPITPKLNNHDRSLPFSWLSRTVNRI